MKCLPLRIVWRIEAAIPSGKRLDPAALMAGCLIFVIVMFIPLILGDNDTLWQIKIGGWILDHRAIPATDPFSFTAGNRRWFAHEWLSETLMALAFRAGGMQGVMVLAATAAGVTGAILMHHLRRFLPGVYAVSGLIVAISNAAPSLLARPHLLAWPCLALWCSGLATARANRTAPSLLLLAVMAVWVNLHGSFMLGLLLSGAFTIESLFDRGADVRRVFVAWGGFSLAGGAVALLNPDFLAGVLFPIHMIGMKSLVWIGEWQPPDFTRFQPVEVIILGGLALGLSGRARLPPIRLLLLLALVYATLAHARNDQLLGIVGALVLAEPLGASLARGSACALGPRWRYMSSGTAVFAAAAMAVRIALPLGPEWTDAAFAAKLGAVPPSLRALPVLNEYGLGGHLIFAGVRPFIDGRADLYGDAFLTQYHQIITPDPAALEHTLSEYDIAWTIFPAGHAIIPVMDGKPGWRRLAETDGIVIHVRQDRLP